MTVTETPSETLEATIARLVADALRACGGKPEGCQFVREHAEASTVIKRPQVLLSGVVSLRVLEALTKPHPQIVIDPKAVVTPSARDWLRQHQVAIVKQSAQPIVKLADPEDFKRGEAVCRQLGLRGLIAELDGLPESGKKTTSLGIVISDLPAIEVDQLSRQHGLCVVAVDSLELVRRILAKMRPDVWVLDSTRLQVSGLVSVAEFCIRGSLAERSGGVQ